MAPPDPVAILLGLGLLVLAVVIVLSIGAILLRAACSICRVESPSFLMALLVTLAVGIVNGIVGFGIGFGVVLAGAGAGADVQTLQALQALSSCASLPINMVISAALYAAMLKTSFGKGILIWLCQLVVLAIIAVAVVVVVVVVMMIAGVAISGIG